MRLVCLAASFAVAAARTVQNEEERYVRRWADNGSRARCDAPSCSWIEAFGPVDVGCRITVDRVGLDDAKGPELTLKFADGSKLALAAATAAGVDRFATRPALCEYAPRGGGEKPGVALLMVANSPAYLFRLWPPFLNKLLYAADAGLRPFLWLGELPEALEHPTNPECLNSKTVALRDLPKGARRLRSFYDHRAGAGDDRDVARVSNHYVKMPAALAALAVVDGKTGVDRLAALRANAKGLRAGLREAFGASSTSSLVVVGPASPDVPFALLALRRSSSSSDDDAAGDLAALDRVADAALAKGYVVAVVVHPNAGGGAAFPALRAKHLALRVCVTAAHDENDVSGLVRALAAAADAV
mmetsp:Transcript_16982/g.52920  ORF Transcript_16982/g.52920 Transcript_16982/m.52920 type:complete len:358 (+) Transcript_16982:1609-2682(+)